VPGILFTRASSSFTQRGCLCIQVRVSKVGGWRWPNQDVHRRNVTSDKTNQAFVLASAPLGATLLSIPTVCQRQITSNLILRLDAL
jgi:hypothetical protein